MAEFVVDLLEVVDVDEEDADDGTGARGAPQRLAEMLHQQAAVGQERQAVVVRKMTDVELGLLALDGVADRPDDDFGRRLSFDEVVLGAVLDGLQRQRVVFRSRQDDERQVRRRPDQAVQRLEFLGVGQAEIEQRDVIRLVREAIDGASNGCRVVEPDARGRRSLQHRLRECRLIRIVLDEEDPERRLGPRALLRLVHAGPGRGTAPLAKRGRPPIS